MARVIDTIPRDEPTTTSSTEKLIDIDDPEYIRASTWHKFLWNQSVESFLGLPRGYPSFALKRETMSRTKFVDRTDTVGEALSLLAENRILSAPVYDSDSNRFIGFIDVLDLVSYIVTELAHPRRQMEQLPKAEARPIWEEVRNQPCWLEDTVGPLIDASERNAWSPIDRRAPLIALFSVLSRTDVHRVPIVDEQEPDPQWKVLSIVTQSQVISWLHRLFGPMQSEEHRKTWNIVNVDFLPAVKDLKLKDFTTPIILGPDMLHLINAKDDLMGAFELIKRADVSAVGVVDDDGRLLGNVSASDVTLVGTACEVVSLLSMRLDKFLEFKGHLMSSVNERYSHPTTICVFKDDTLGCALEKLAVNRIHRLWIVSDHKHGSTTGEGDEAAEAGTSEFVGGGGPRGEHIRQEDEETGEIDRELAKLKQRKRKNIAGDGFYPIGCLSLCDIINELASYGTGNDRVLRSLKAQGLLNDQDLVEADDPGIEEEDEDEDVSESGQ